MAVTNFTPLLGLALPTTGDLSGTWGTTVNTAITDLLDDAVAGTVTLTTDANTTLTTTNGADNQARNAIILCTGARTAIRTITAPAQSKLYVIINATSGGFGVKIVGAGPTTGITVLAGTQTMVVWNGTDFAVTASGDLVGPASSTDNAITRFDLTTGKLVQNSLVTVADDGAIVAPQVGSIIPFYYANQAAFPSAATYHGALAHSHADGAMFFAHGSVWNRLLDESTDVTVAQGGTGLSTLTANNVILGNGTSTPLFVAPSTSGNVLTSNGTTWQSTTPASGFSVAANNTFTGTQSFAGTSSNLAEVLTNAAEVTTVSATAATGTINYDVTTQSVQYYTSNASANWTVNFRASSGTSLNTAMTTGQSVTVAFLVTQGATAYYNSVVKVDGTTVTPKYQGGTAYAAGNASSVDVYMYTIIKTGSAAFTVFTSQTKFA